MVATLRAAGRRAISLGGPRLTAAILSAGVAATAVLQGQEPLLLNDDGGWCWFQDERAVFHHGRLVVGSIASGRFDASRRGDVEITILDLESNRLSRVELSDRFQLDDHNAPALLPLADDGLLAVYAQHGPENRFYAHRASSDLSAWTTATPHVASESSRITYSHLVRLAAESDRIYNFFRGLDGSWKPSWVFSEDGGASWRRGGILIDVPSQDPQRPYLKVRSRETDSIHFVYTEGHPRDVDNSLFHVVYRDRWLRRSGGRRIARLERGLAAPKKGTRIFAGRPDRVAWVADLEVDDADRPVVVYSVQHDSAGLPKGSGGSDHRYRYARWSNRRWSDHALAFAGTRLYAGEDDYTGLAAIAPADPARVVISTNADPETGEPLISGSDDRRHWELFEGRTADGGASWTWTAITRDSKVDNLRPIVVASDDGMEAVLWLRGTYRRYTDYELEVVAIVRARRQE